MQFADKQERDEYIAADLFRYTGKTDRRTLRRCRRHNNNFRATYYMRMCAWARQQTLLRYTLFPLYKLRMRRACACVGIEMHESTQIGKGFHIAHHGCMIVHTGAVLGDNVSISQGVTIGQTIRDGKVQLPVIGSNVYIAPGAKVIGGVHVGNHVSIGANAVVTHDVPDGAVVAGIPARVLHMGCTDEYLLNPYTEKDDVQ